MGIMEGYPRKPFTQHHPDQMETSSGATNSHGSVHRALVKKWRYSDNTKTFLLFVVTNSLSVFVAICVSSVHAGRRAELDATLSSLAASQRLATYLHRRIGDTHAVIERVMANSGHLRMQQPAAPEQTPEEELTLALGPHTLPLGYTANLGTDRLYPAIGVVCHRHRDELEAYMRYDIGGDCPSDAAFAERLMLQGCEPLPRRRCRARAPASFPEPTPFPKSLWNVPPDTSVVWDPYPCKNYSCLVDQANSTGSHGCKGCFDLAGREKHRWVGKGGELDYTIDSVLAAKPLGTVRIGLDIGGGTGTFAARMAERGVTVVTTTLDLGAPFGAFVASRGLVPLHLGAVSQRLPFFDGTLDIVRSRDVLGHRMPGAVLDAELYDIRRVLRPGGLLWLDRFFCTGSELADVYAPMIEKVGFRKLRWNTGRKLDGGPQTDEWYISALLEKPMT